MAQKRESLSEIFLQVQVLLFYALMGGAAVATVAGFWDPILAQKCFPYGAFAGAYLGTYANMDNGG